MSERNDLTPSVTSRDHTQGGKNARLTLVEFGDYQCPYCGAAYPVVKGLQEEFGSDLRFVYRNFPIAASHPYAMVAAESAEAAAVQSKFWELHDLIYENQRRLTPSFLRELAESLGLDMQRFGSAIQSRLVQERIGEDRKSGIRSGVQGTPSFFINGARFDGETDELRDILLTL
jgi:protein-disulfide isomerase